MKDVKTVKELMELLPVEYRSKAIENTSDKVLNSRLDIRTFKHQGDLVVMNFSWNESKEGADFWRKAHLELSKRPI